MFDNLNKSLTWITFINHGYIHYTKNFLESMKRANVEFKLIVFCADDKSFEELEYTNCLRIKADFLKCTLASDMKGFFDLEYKQIVFSKLDVIKYALQHLGVEAVGYIDTDIVLFSDPSTIMLSKMKQHPDIDIFCQCDEEGTKCMNVRSCMNICTGVIVFRNKKELYKIFDYKPHNMVSSHTDQHYLTKYFILNNHYMEKKINYLTIEKHILANGSFFPDIKTTKIEIPPSCCLLHFNYLVGGEKEQCMKFQNLWFI